MTYGLKTLNPDGTSIIDASIRAGRYLGMVDSGTSDGSVSHPDLAQGSPWAVVIPSESLLNNKSGPVLSFSGTTISWHFDYSTRMNVTIVYGVY